MPPDRELKVGTRRDVGEKQMLAVLTSFDQWTAGSGLLLRHGIYGSRELGSPSFSKSSTANPAPIRTGVVQIRSPQPAAWQPKQR